MIPSDRSQPSKWTQFFLAVTSIPYFVSILFHLYLILYSRYTADDFCSAGTTLTMGVLGSANYWYLTWSDRFSANLLDALVGSLGTSLYPLSVILILTGWLLSTCFLAWRCFQKAFNQKHWLVSLLVTASVFAAILNTTPAVEQSIYWGQGIRTLVPPLAINILFYAYLLGIDARHLPARKFHFAAGLSFFGGLISGGFNETGLAVQLGWVILLLVYLAVSRQKLKARLPGFFLAGSLAALAFMLLSPGLPIRQSGLNMTTNPVDLIELTLRVVSGFLWYMFANHSWQMAGIFLIGLALPVVLKPGASILLPLRNLCAFIFISLVLMVFVSALPAAYSMSAPPPSRTLLIPVTTWILALLCLGLFFGMYLKPAITTARTAEVALAGLIICLAVLNNYSAVQQTSADIRAYREYARQWEARDQSIRAGLSQGLTHLQILPLPNPAELDDLRFEPTYWLNICMNRYYGITLSQQDAPYP